MSICQSSVPTERWEEEMGESLEGNRLGIWYPQWKNSKETLFQKIWKLRMNTQSCPQIATCTPWHTGTDIGIFKCPHHTCANKIMR